MGQFGVSQPVRRREDVRLLNGNGQFIDDNDVPNPAYAYLLRSPLAHARITHLDTQQASQAPGVLAIYTAQDLQADNIGAINCLTQPKPKPGTRYHEHLQPLLVNDTVRYVGDGIAFIVAESLSQARDASELIDIEFDELAAVTACDQAAQADAVPLWETGNICYQWELGDAAASSAAFASAAHRVSLTVCNNRVVLNAIETRGAIGSYSAEQEKYTLRTGTQMPNSTRDQLADAVFKTRRENIRVLSADVGGGFGGKNSLYPEQALVLYAARKLDRTVKWQADRSEAFISDFHGRDNISRGELAIDENGHFLAVRVNTYANLGAYTAGRGTLSPLNVAMVCNCYRIPVVHIDVTATYSNTVPTDPYRGAGRPEILYLIERLVDTAAFDIGIDRIELRRRNYIQAHEFPYTTATGLTYDHSDFGAIMQRALDESDWHNFAQRRQKAVTQGKLRGIGLANYIERCGGGGGLSENAHLSFSPDGMLILTIGTMSNGQGHTTAYSQILHQQLQIPFAKILVIQGDTDQIPSGNGTGGSWSIPMGGSAVFHAAEKLIETAREQAGRYLEAADEDIEYQAGAFQITGTDRTVSWQELVKVQPDLAATSDFKPDNYTFPYGCHVCEVEVDPDTGSTDIIAYTAVHDFGRALNPLLLAGQVHGGLAQGIGQALLEFTAYDDSGQLLSGSYMDYSLPRADDLPEFKFIHQDTPSPANPLGVKGCGEAGAAGSPPAFINALCDALSLRHIDMPARPETVWQQIINRGSDHSPE